jgi:hypothetical protein
MRRDRHTYTYKKLEDSNYISNKYQLHNLASDIPDLFINL